MPNDNLSDRASSKLNLARATYDDNLLAEQERRALYQPHSVVAGYQGNQMLVKALDGSISRKDVITTGATPIGSPVAIRGDTANAMPYVERQPTVVAPVAVGLQIKFIALTDDETKLDFWLCGHVSKPVKIYSRESIFISDSYEEIALSDDNYLFNLRCDATGDGKDDWCISFGISEVVSYEEGTVERANTLYKLTKSSGITEIFSENFTNQSYPSGAAFAQSLSYNNEANGYWNRILNTINRSGGVTTTTREASYYWNGDTFSSTATNTQSSGNESETGSFYPVPDQELAYSYTRNSGPPATATGSQYRLRTLINKEASGAIGDNTAGLNFTNFSFFDGSVTNQPSGLLLYSFYYFQVSVLKTKVAVVRNLDDFGTAQKLKADVDLYDLDTMTFQKTMKADYYRSAPLTNTVYISNLSFWTKT